MEVARGTSVTRGPGGNSFLAHPSLSGVGAPSPLQGVSPFVGS